MPALHIAAINVAAIAPALARNPGEGVPGFGQNRHGTHDGDPLDVAAFEGKVGHQLLRSAGRPAILASQRFSRLDECVLPLRRTRVPVLLARVDHGPVDGGGAIWVSHEGLFSGPSHAEEPHVTPQALL